MMLHCSAVILSSNRNLLWGSMALMACACTANETLGGQEAQTPAESGAGTSMAAESPESQPLHFVGRVELSFPERPTFQWSGTGVITTFEGSEISVTLDDNGNQFTIVLDGEPQSSPLITQSGEKNYLLAENLVEGQHVLELYRRTEASFGPTVFLGFQYGREGQALPAPTLSRRLEVIGDSISTAYGNLGESTACGFSADTQNHFLSYGALSARSLNAELSTVAWSGKGIIYNYDRDIVDPMPTIYDRTLPGDAGSVWDYSSWQADAVIINLGTNDFSTDEDPSEDLFREEYVKLLERVRLHYPQAAILCTVGPLLNGQDIVDAREGISTAVAQFESQGGENIRIWEMLSANPNPGCDYHPSLATHQAMADELTTQLRAMLNW